MVPREPHIERLKELIERTKDELRVSRYYELEQANRTKYADLVKEQNRKTKNFEDI